MSSIAVVWIAVVVFSLQIAEPFRYAYEYDSAIVLSGNRLRQLNAHIDSNDRDDCDFRVTLQTGIQTVEGRPSELTPGIPNLHARGVTVRTHEPADAKRLSQILSAASFVQDTEAAEALRKAARWNRHCTEVFEHQLASSQRILRQHAQIDGTSPTIKLASTASLARNRSTEVETSIAPTLEAKLKALRKDQAELDRKLVQRQGFASGVLSVSKPWRIGVKAVHTDRLRLLAALTGSLAAAFAASSLSIPKGMLVRKRTAWDVLRRQLAAMGIEELQVVGLSPVPTLAVNRSVTHAPVYDWIYRTSKGLIVLTLALAAARLLFDPLWRDLCLDSPLAAIAAITDFRIGRA